ncbi:proton/sodium-glutamate symporter [Marinomonas sp. MED121]|uniref:dicarboxylate/amino acid:cation symporter n=1 Tax=Marinomonas sp. MED121 TaxID=314277 RepID=UPI0000691171|nr:dicarboxylate/amino acid:cation symporter [Marinomonas sp. MED121]EAQ67430.1 proton/sodium-glutamate symporter [Marinomonas sp. MED121]
MTSLAPWYQPFDNQLKQISMLLKNQLWMQIIVALILGVTLGLMLSPSGGGLVEADTAAVIAQWVKLPGTVFLALIQMVVVPLVLSSIMLGIATAGDPEYLKKIGLRIFPYFVSTTTVAVIIGASLVLWIEPGQYMQSQIQDQMGGQQISGQIATDEDAGVPIATLKDTSVPDKISGLIPTNMTKATLDKSMLQLVVYAMIMGVALVALPPKKSKVLLQALDSVQAIAMQVVSWAMLLAPLAVFGLLCEITIRIGVDALLGMSIYVLTVILGLVFLWVFYLLIIRLVASRSVWRFSKGIRSVQLLAFSTSSSAAVMPLSLKTSEQSLGVKPSVGQFVIPLGATINMDGTALYQTIAAIFLVQAFGVEITTSELLLLMLTTIGASIGAPSTPGVGIVILATLLGTVGVPAAGIGLILGVDRILDMCRTTLNVTGDLTACCVMDKWLPESGERKERDYWKS